MFQAILLSCVLLFSSTPPGPPNPYCGTSPSTFYPVPIPLDFCGEGSHFNATCRDACSSLYTTELQNLYEDACQTYDSFNQLWSQWQDAINQIHDVCLLHATTQQQIDNCNSQHQSRSDLNLTGLTNARTSLQNNVAAGIQAATNDLYDCLGDCCEDDH